MHAAPHLSVPSACQMQCNAKDTGSTRLEGMDPAAASSNDWITCGGRAESVMIRGL